MFRSKLLGRIIKYYWGCQCSSKTGQMVSLKYYGVTKQPFWLIHPLRCRTKRYCFLKFVLLHKSDFIFLLLICIMTSSRRWRILPFCLPHKIPFAFVSSRTELSSHLSIFNKLIELRSLWFAFQYGWKIHLNLTTSWKSSLDLVYPAGLHPLFIQVFP